MTPEEKAKAYDEAIAKAQKELQSCGSKDCDAARQIYRFFPELQESEDERIRKEIISHLRHEYVVKRYVSDVEYDRWIAWLEKQGKSKWTDEDEKRLQSCIITLQGKGLMGGVDTIDTKWLKSLKQRIHVSSAKTCKNDTLLDLLQKMPSCITVDGIDYHFVIKKTSIYIAYYACYNGNGEEGRGNAIFGITANSPIDLLTEMLEHLKKKGLLK